MNRSIVIKELMKKKKLNNYLEVGVFNGGIFLNLKSNFKIAVDPKFAFDTLRKIGKTIINPYNIYNRYFEKTADDFFSQDAPAVFSTHKCDLALIDGMHEYDFVLRDIESTLKYLSDDGVIVVHDCNPITKQDACTFAEWRANDFRGVWNGDVWKAILHLRCLRKDINVFVLDCDHGLGIITKNNPENMLNFSQAEINNLKYEDFDKNRSNFLNLKPPSYFREYFKF